MSLGRGCLLSCALVATLLGSACATTPRAAAPATTAGAAPATTGAAAESEPDDANDDVDVEADSNDTRERDEAGNVAGPCPTEMVLVQAGARRFCIDKYEGSLVEVLADGSERPFAHYVSVDGHSVRAVSRPHVFPQGYISEVQAQEACAASSKRLCKLDEWKTACMGPAHTVFPYGDARRPGACHDTGKSAVGAVFGAKALAASTPVVVTSGHANAKRAHTTKGRAAQTTQARAKTAGKASSKKGTRHAGKKGVKPVSSPSPARVDASVEPSVWTRLNDPALGQVDGALAKTGEHAECVNGFGVFDMVGNLHEWVATDTTSPRGLFAGGYYLDTAQNGDGCNYKTTAHAHDYHDYSTGFRCCAAAGL